MTFRVDPTSTLGLRLCVHGGEKVTRRIQDGVTRGEVKKGLRREGEVRAFPRLQRKFLLQVSVKLG